MYGPLGGAKRGDGPSKEFRSSIGLWAAVGERPPPRYVPPPMCSWYGKHLLKEHALKGTVASPLSGTLSRPQSVPVQYRSTGPLSDFKLADTLPSANASLKMAVAASGHTPGSPKSRERGGSRQRSLASGASSPRTSTVSSPSMRRCVTAPSSLLSPGAMSSKDVLQRFSPH